MASPTWLKFLVFAAVLLVVVLLASPAEDAPQPAGASAATSRRGSAAHTAKPDDSAQRAKCPNGVLLTDITSNEASALPLENRTVRVIAAPQRKPEAALRSSWKIPQTLNIPVASSAAPIAMAHQVEQWCAMNPAFQCTVWVAREQRDFIANYSGPRALAAYDSLVAHDQKEELFTYSYLSERGGVVVNSRTEPRKPLDSVITASDRFVGVVSKDSGMLQTAFLAATADDVIFREALQEAVDASLRHFYGETPWAVTGASVLTQSFQRLVRMAPASPADKLPLGYKVLAAVAQKPCGAWQAKLADNGNNAEPLLLSAYRGAPEDRLWFHNQPPVELMWKRGLLFTTKVGSSDAAKVCPDGVLAPKAIAAVPRNERKLIVVPTRRAPTAVGSAQKIPKVVLQTGISQAVPKAMWKAMEEWRELNPDYTFLYFNEADQRRYIKINFGVDVQRAFAKLASPTMRSEMFRYCFLYRRGGIYVDTAVEPLALSLENLVEADTSLLLLSQSSPACHKRPTKKCVRINPLIMGSVARKALFRELFMEVTFNVLNDNYGIHPDDVTGWGPLTRNAIRYVPYFNPNVTADKRDVPGLQLLRYLKLPLCLKGNVYTAAENSLTFLVYYADYLSDKSWYNPEDSAVMWSDRRLFLSELTSQFGQQQPPKQQAVDAKELERRKLCPYGQTEMVAYNPPPTPLDHRYVLEMPKHTPARQKPTTTQLIPRIIMQTAKYDAVPVGMFAAINEVKEHNPDYEHYYFSDNDAREYIIHKTNSTILEVFEALIPGAFKSDFFRYVFLYLNGGVYVDADQVSVDAMNLEPSDTFVSAEDPGSGGVSGLVYNAYMAVVPKHPIIERVLADVIRSVSARVYNTDVLAVTGPTALLKAFTTVVGENAQPNRRYPGSVRLTQYTKGEQCAIGFIRWHENVTFNTRYPTYKREMKWYLGQGHYWDMWNNREIYKPLAMQDQYGRPLSEEDALVLAQKKHVTNDECPFGEIEVPDHLQPQHSASEKAKKRGERSDARKQLERMAKKDDDDDQQWEAAHSVKTDGTVPRVILQVVPTYKLPKGMLKAMKGIRAASPKFQYRLFDEADARKWLAGLKNATLLTAFDKSKTWAIRAAVFAHAYIYHEGGVFLTPAAFMFKGVPGQPVPKPEEKDVGIHVLPEDRFFSTGTPHKIYANEIFGAVPKHFVVSAFLDALLRHVKAGGTKAPDALFYGAVFERAASVQNILPGLYADGNIRLQDRHPRGLQSEGWLCSISHHNYVGKKHVSVEYAGYRVDRAWFYPSADEMKAATPAPVATTRQRRSGDDDEAEAESEASTTEASPTTKASSAARRRTPRPTLPQEDEAEE